MWWVVIVGTAAGGARVAAWAVGAGVAVGAAVGVALTVAAGVAEGDGVAVAGAAVALVAEGVAPPGLQAATSEKAPSTAATIRPDRRLRYVPISATSPLQCQGAF
jgi:hypothetical protein